MHTAMHLLRYYSSFPEVNARQFTNYASHEQFPDQGLVAFYDIDPPRKKKSHSFPRKSSPGIHCVAVHRHLGRLAASYHGVLNFLQFS